MNLNLDKVLDILVTELNRWVEAFIKVLPNIAFAAIILVCSMLLASVVKKLTRSLFSKSTRNQAALHLVEKVLSVVVFAVGFFMALGVLNLDKTVTSLLAGAGVLGLALGFAFQEIVSNFVSGVLIAFQEPYRIGDIVEVAEFVGTVKEIELRSTIITTFTGLDVLVPNKDMYTKALTNYTSTPYRKVQIAVGVSYGDDLRKVERVAIKAVEGIEGRIAGKEAKVFYTDFGDSSINFLLEVWIEYPANDNYKRFRHSAIIAVKEAFDREGITIPFPMRTLDFGDQSIKISKL